MWYRLLPGFLVLAACADAGPSSALVLNGRVEPGKGTSEQFCPAVPASIKPTDVSYGCGAIDAFDGAIMTDVNRFWRSQVLACATQPDFPQGVDGAWSLDGKGVIYIGLKFMSELARSGSVPVQYALAHQLGHEIEGNYMDRSPSVQDRELTADCLAGYYFGSLVCRGLASEDDVKTVLGSACIITDGTGNPVTDDQTHGTCDQRIASITTGMHAYLAGDLPLDACAP